MIIISQHVPKAAGSTLRNLFINEYGHDAVFLDYDDPPSAPSSSYHLDPLGYLRKRTASIPSSIRVIHGHFHAAKYDLVSDAYRLTFLRHPVSNIISIYLFWKRIPAQQCPLHQYFIKERLSILDFAKLPIQQSLLQDSYFGNWDINKMDFVGSHENRDSDLEKLGLILGVKFDKKLHNNKTSEFQSDEYERNAILNNKKIMDSLNEILIDEIQFYEKAIQVPAKEIVKGKTFTRSECQKNIVSRISELSKQILNASDKIIYPNDNTFKSDCLEKISNNLTSADENSLKSIFPSLYQKLFEKIKSSG